MAWTAGDLDRCLRGDARAWDGFVETFGPHIRATVARALSGRDEGLGFQDAEDAVQTVFMRLVDNDRRLLRSFDARRSTLATWLAVVSRSTAIDHLRTRRSQRRCDALAPAPTRGPAGADGPGPMVSGDLLSGRQRLVLHMLFDRGWSVEQAAEAMAVDCQTVRSTKHKAIEKLRQHFKVSQ